MRDKYMAIALVVLGGLCFITGYNEYSLAEEPNTAYNPIMAYGGMILGGIMSVVGVSMFTQSK
ncbi:hypothetical protein [Bacillus sp. FJAT-45350]|uniref:hypothetical protein n=1 Tax=Bacillus sp. FJAT-45350 TaxID=2011014 RepID=UPI000BB6AA76|nr:hypothetical protein [Bacillus sp. FJAT-45350]